MRSPNPSEALIALASVYVRRKICVTIAQIFDRVPEVRSLCRVSHRECDFRRIFHDFFDEILAGSDYSLP